MRVLAGTGPCAWSRRSRWWATWPEGAIQAVEVVPPTNKVRVSAEGALFRVEAGETGVSEPVRLQVTAADGSRLTSDPIRFASDFQAPSLELERPASGDWLAAELRLEGQAADAGGLASLEYALDGGEFTALPAAGRRDRRFRSDRARERAGGRTAPARGAGRGPVRQRSDPAGGLSQGQRRPRAAAVGPPRRRTR